MSPDKKNPDPDQFTFSGQTVGEEKAERQDEIDATTEQIAATAEQRPAETDKEVSEAAVEQGHDPNQTSMAEAAREKIRRILGKDK